MRCRRRRLAAGLVAFTLVGCGGDDGSFADDGFETDPLPGVGSGGDDGPAATTGGPSDDGGDDGDVPPPEMEEEADFRVPRASGRWVYSASEITNSVAVIDSDTLSIDVVGVGRGPTVVAPLGMQGRVAVLDQGSDDVAMLRTSPAGTEVEIVPSSPGANNLAVSPDGDVVFVYHDVDASEPLGAGSDQELTVIEATTSTVHEMTIGVHPRDVVFTSDSKTAYVITDDGVNIVPMDGLAMIGKPDLVPVVNDPGIDPSTLEIQVAADAGVALARREGEDILFATDLGSGEQFSFQLDSVATDLDIAADGTFAIITLPSTEGSTFMELALPLSSSPTIVSQSVGDEYVGLAHLSPDGDTMLLYTTVNPFPAGGSGGAPPLDDDDPPTFGGMASSSSGGSDAGSSSGDTGTDATGSSSGDDGQTGDSDTGSPIPEPQDDPRLRITIARRTADTWDDQVTLFVDRPVVAVGIAPDGANAMLLHGRDDSVSGSPYAYTLLDLTKPFPVKKLQIVQSEPGPILFTPNGDQAVVLLPDSGTQRIDRVDLRTFIVDGLALGSPPEGAGFVDETEKVFVSQEHPTGRITFIDPAGQVQTVTGFRLNDAVKD